MKSSVLRLAIVVVALAFVTAIVVAQPLSMPKAKPAPKPVPKPLAVKPGAVKPIGVKPAPVLGLPGTWNYVSTSKAPYFCGLLIRARPGEVRRRPPGRARQVLPQGLRRR